MLGSRRARPGAGVPPLPPRALGLLLGVLADRALGDPRRGHPVAGFGQAVTALERRSYADSRGRGVAFTAVVVGVTVGAGRAVEQLARRHPVVETLAVAAATWAVLGGTSLGREGVAVAQALESDDLAAARSRVRNLCARDPAALDAGGVARATVESLAENTSDAVVAPLLWGAVAGVPGLLGYRAVNTLDAMVGYTSPRYLRFGWASARLDDVVNLVPARVTGLLTAACAGVVGGSAAKALEVLRRDGASHPSPNAGRPEAAAAGALGVRLGGTNVYDGHPESRAVLGQGRPPAPRDVRRSVRLAAAVGVWAAVLAVGLATGLASRRPTPAGRG